MKPLVQRAPQVLMVAMLPCGIGKFDRKLLVKGARQVLQLTGRTRPCRRL